MRPIDILYPGLPCPFRQYPVAVIHALAMSAHGLDIATLLILLARQSQGATIGRKTLAAREDPDGDDGDDDDDVLPPAAPTTTVPAVAETTAPAPTYTDVPAVAPVLDTGNKVGIVIAVILVVVFFGGVTFEFWRQRMRRRRRERESRDPPDDTKPNDSRPPNSDSGQASFSENAPPGSVSPPSTNPDTGQRPWFEKLGFASTELPVAREVGDGRDGVASRVYKKAELSAPGPGDVPPPRTVPEPAAGNTIHEASRAGVRNHSPVELPAPVSRRPVGVGMDVARDFSTRMNSTEETGRDSTAYTFTVSSPTNTVAETSISAEERHGQVSPGSPHWMRSVGATM